MTTNLPKGVAVVEEWGVRSDDGNIYGVQGGRAEAERNAAMLQRDDEDGPEPGASPAHRYVMTTPEGVVAVTGWTWTLGWKPANGARP